MRALARLAGSRGLMEILSGKTGLLAVCAGAAALTLSAAAADAARAQDAAVSQPAGRSPAPLAVLETLLFPPGQEQVVRFDEPIVGGARVLTPTRWDAPGVRTPESHPIRTLLKGDFSTEGTGLAKGRPANLVQLYAASLEPFFGHPDLVLRTAFDAPPAVGEQLMVVERPDCIVVASHRQGRISRMASVSNAEALGAVGGEAARDRDCRTRTGAAAVGAWGVFHPLGAAVVQKEGWTPPAGPSAALFDPPLSEALPRIEPGLSRQGFYDLTAGLR
jgi:hypothetical protein